MLLLVSTNIFIHIQQSNLHQFKKYIYSNLPVYILFTIIFAHIYEMSSFTFNELYPSHSRSKYSFSIFCAPPSRIGQYKTQGGLRTTDYGLGIKHGLSYKRRTKHYGLGIKYGLTYKTRTVRRYGLGIKHEERFYKLNKFSH